MDRMKEAIKGISSQNSLMEAGKNSILRGGYKIFKGTKYLFDGGWRIYHLIQIHDMLDARRVV